MKHRIKLSALALCVVLVGCGGGGGGGNGGGGGGGTPTPATQLRLYKSGDTMTYAVTGTYQDTNGAYPVKGSATLTLGNATFNGQSVISETTVLSLTVQDHSLNITGIAYFTQDPVTHDVYELAYTDSKGVTHTDVAPTLLTPGTINATTSLNDTFNYTDGTWKIRTSSVVGAETVQTPAGSFNCWKVNQSEKDSDGTSISGTDWTDPNVGGDVREIGEGTQTNPYSYLSLTEVLSAYNTRSWRNVGFLPPPCGILNGHIMRELMKQIKAHRTSTIP